MNKIPNSTELVVIFKRIKREIPPDFFHPCAVLPGKLNKKNMTFIDTDGKEHLHLVETEEGCGYALRTTVGKLRKFYKKKTLGGLCKAYLKDLQLDFYYYATTDPVTYKDLAFITEDREYHTTYALYDEDLDQIMTKKVTDYLRQEENTKKEYSNLINTKALIHEVKNKVLGQDEAIEDIVSILWQNSKGIRKSNILIIGPTGVGKTEIIRVISKELKIPMVIVNAAELTQTGYQGNSVEDVLKSLLLKSQNDKNKAEHGIIVLDEIDKLAQNDNSFGQDNVATTGVQQELLKLLEDGTYYLNIGTVFEPEMIMLNTEEITVIGVGAFSNLDKIQKQSQKKLGFSSNQSTQNNLTKSKITSEDLFRYGLIPELVGRFSNIIELSPLDKEHLIQIIKNPHGELLNSKIKILESEGIQLQMSDDVYEKIAKDALEKKTGARGLIGTVDSLFVKAMREISQNKGLYNELIIKEETVDNPNHYRLVKKVK